MRSHSRGSPEESDPQRQEVEAEPGAGGGEGVFDGDRGSVWENEEVLETDGEDGDSAVCVCLMPPSRALNRG